MKMMCTWSYSDDRSRRNAILIDAHDLLTCLFFIPASRVQHPITGRWNPATVHAESDEPRSYILRNMNGKEFRRNRQHIRESCQLPHQNVEPPENAHATPTPTRLPTVSTETELPNTVVPSVPPSTPARYTTRSGRVVRSPRRLDY